MDPEVAVFSEARGKEVEKHTTFKLVPHQAWVSSARKEILELARALVPSNASLFGGRIDHDGEGSPGLAPRRGVNMSHGGGFFHRADLKSIRC